MILTEYVNLKISPNNYKHLTEIGYDTKVGDYIHIKVNDLSKGSGYIIDVKCDICDKERKIQYRMYLRSLKTKNIYTCSSCNHTKKDIHSTPESREKGKKTCLEKYGDENYNNREKYRETLLERYGDEKYNNTEKNIETCLKKHGVENVFQLEYIKVKSKETKLEKYGDENYNNNEKMLETNLEKYGDENYRNDEKRKVTMVERYGVEYPTQNEGINKKAQETIRNGFAISKEDTEWNNYKKAVKRVTNKYKNQLFDNWDGTDYYDNEYIKDETKYNSNGYRSIDHKISIFEGFKLSISPEIIGNIDNLCITKRIINSTKQKRTETDFL